MPPWSRDQGSLLSAVEVVVRERKCAVEYEWQYTATALASSSERAVDFRWSCCSPASPGLVIPPLLPLMP